MAEGLGGGENRSASSALLEHNYRILRRLLAANSEMLELLSDLETDLRHVGPEQSRIRRLLLQLLDGSLLIAESLNALTGERNRALYDVHQEIEKSVRAYLRSVRATDAGPLCLPLDSAGAGRAREVGGKAANLGELRRAMPEAVPDGFVITTAAYRLFLKENELHGPILRLFQDLSLITDRDLFRQRTAAIRSLVEGGAIPAKIRLAIDEGLARFSPAVPKLWAVRSSAVGEDGQLSFAGQFDSVLHVPADELGAAYRKVIASRYSDRAVLYRLVGGFSEVGTPMAVLFLPMLEARFAGVLYTRDPGGEASDRMLVNAVPGLAEDMVRGVRAADSFLVTRSRPATIVEHPSGRPGPADRPAEGEEGPSGRSLLTAGEIVRLMETGLEVEQHFGCPQDIEWVMTPEGRPLVVQARPLRAEEARSELAASEEGRAPLLHDGITVCPGRAVGAAHLLRNPLEPGETPEGAILVVRQATPELTAVLPSVCGVIAEQGNLAGHAATVIREFGLPSLFGVEGALERLREGQALSLDATQRKVYAGSLWPGLSERRPSRIREASTTRAAGPLHDRILLLNLTDPLSSAFAASKCRSVHDMIRYTHEKAVAAMFELGDVAVRHGQRRVWWLKTAIPLQLTALDLGGSLSPEARDRKWITPEEIRSIPFAGLWKGVADSRVSWSGHRKVSASGFASVLGAAMTGPPSAVRELGATNYVIVGPEYLNLNARLAYHFAMVDALVTDAAENNYVNFRFRGGGASFDRRDLRARFLAGVLHRADFSVDQRGDLVTAWLRRYPRETSEEGLALIGRLMACARQLDMLMDDPAMVPRYVDSFLKGDYQAFA